MLVYAHRCIVHTCSTHLNGIFYASGDAHWIYHGETAVFTASCYCFCIYWLLTLLYFSAIHISSKSLVWVDVLVFGCWWYVVLGRGYNLRRWTRIAGSREFKDLFEMRIWFYQYFIFIYTRTQTGQMPRKQFLVGTTMSRWEENNIIYIYIYTVYCSRSRLPIRQQKEYGKSNTTAQHHHMYLYTSHSVNSTKMYRCQMRSKCVYSVDIVFIWEPFADTVLKLFGSKDSQ